MPTMISCFDELNVDLLFEIFDYLSFNDLSKAFFGLKEYLDKVIQVYPAKIDLSSVSDHNTLQQGLFCCRSLKVSENDHQKLQMTMSRLVFAALQAVTLERINLAGIHILDASSASLVNDHDSCS
jgi:hypothetical protein